MLAREGLLLLAVAEAQRARRDARRSAGATATAATAATTPRAPARRRGASLARAVSPRPGSTTCDRARRLDLRRRRAAAPVNPPISALDGAAAVAPPEMACKRGLLEAAELAVEVE